METRFRAVAKVFLKALLAIVCTALVSICILVYLVFTPHRLTPIVNRVADSLLVVPHSLDRVELTFFRTFPRFGLEVENLLLENGVPGAPSDTVLYVPSLLVSVNTRKLIKDRVLDVNKVRLRGARANVFIDRYGKGNFEVVEIPPPDTLNYDSSQGPVLLPFSIGVARIDISGLAASFVSEADSIVLRDVKISLSADADMSDTLFPINAGLRELSIDWKDLHASLDADAGIGDSLAVNLRTLDILVGKLGLSARGMMTMPMSGGGITADADVCIRGWTPDDIISLAGSSVWSCIPSLERTVRALPDMIPEKLYVSGAIDADIHACGRIDSLSLPSVDARLKISDITGHYDYDVVPFNIENGSADIEASSDLTHPGTSRLCINDISANIRSLYNPEPEKLNSVRLGGILSDMFPKDDFSSFDPYLKLDLEAGLDVREATPYLKPVLDSIASGIPEAVYKIFRAWNPMSNATRIAGEAMENSDIPSGKAEMRGYAKLNVNLHNRLSAITDFVIKDIKGDVTLDVADLNVRLMDGYDVKVDSVRLNMQAPVPDFLKTKLNEFTSTRKDERFRTYAYTLDIGKTELSTPVLKAVLPGASLEMMEEYSPDTLVKEVPDGIYAFLFKDISVTTCDDEKFVIGRPFGRFQCRPSDGNPHLETWIYEVSTDKLIYNYLGKDILSTGNIDVNLTEKENPSGSNYMLKWNPVFSFNAREMKYSAEYAGQSIDIDLPLFDVTVKDQVAGINNSRVRVGRSDFSLTGNVRQFGLWREGSGNLVADLRFKSDYTDVDELMTMAATYSKYMEDYGFTSADTVSVAQVQDADTSVFFSVCIPRDMDIAVEASIDSARILKQDARGLKANLYVNDGTAYAQDVEFNCDAARMRLSAKLYAPAENGSPYVDSTYLGFNFRMEDVDIKKAVDIIPKVDSLMPMLRTFAGKVNLDLAYSASYDSLYYVRPESLDASINVSGKDLMLVPTEIYDKISRFMLVKRNDNRIDSLFVEARWRDSSIVVYPFILSLSRCRVAVSGSNVLDSEGYLKGIDYHISMLRPLHMGMNLEGSLSDLSFRLVRPRYKDSFSPVRRYEVKAQAATIEEDIGAAVEMFLGVLR